MSKFAIIEETGTNGINCNVAPGDIVGKLEKWDSEYGVSISGVGHASFDMKLGRLPDDLDAFAQELYEFCPDIVDQGLDLVGEFIEAKRAAGQEIDSLTADLVNGVDLEADGSGLVLLRRSLELNCGSIGFWWD